MCVLGIYQQQAKGSKSSYPLGELGIANRAEHLLVCHEAVESSRPVFTRTIVHFDGKTVSPLNAVGHWEHGLHELILVAVQDVNVTDAHPRNLADCHIVFDTIDCLSGLLIRDEFHVAISSFSRGTLHQDVNGPVCSEASMTTKEVLDFLTSRSVGHL